jgi:hypothetical protein
MQGRCDKHLFEAAEDRCGRCGFEFCGECLVYSFGLKKPPLCIPCAVVAAGIRSNAAPPPIEARARKQLRKERRSAFRRGRRAESATPELDALPADDLSVDDAPILPVNY